MNGMSGQTLLTTFVADTASVFYACVDKILIDQGFYSLTKVFTR